jgi:UDP-N-acetyl-D-mannosaminuronic acid dehydrogenase
MPDAERLHGKSVAIIGGCGHVGLPLGVKLAIAGATTRLVDVNQDAVDEVNAGRFPFLEKGGDEQLQAALQLGLKAVTNPATAGEADVLIFVTGTPVDEHLNPKLSEVMRIIELYEPYLRPGKLVIMRSTLMPGTMEHLHERLSRTHPGVRIAFCPERVAQGFALDEIESLPQIVSAFDDESFDAAVEVFGALAPTIVKLSPIEAELSKLMANSWRYLEFSIANQFYMICESRGVNFQRVYKAIRHDYPRAAGYKASGFAAGPCLFKDTMQLASYFDNRFYLGHAAMLVNEGLAAFVAERVKRELGGGSLWGRTVGLLGMTFKPDNDDVRDSLSFKVRKLLEFAGARVLCADPYLDWTTPLETVLAESDVLVLSTPHRAYRDLKLEVPVVDVWGIYDDPELEIFLTAKGSEAATARSGGKS